MSELGFPCVEAKKRLHTKADRASIRVGRLSVSDVVYFVRREATVEALKTNRFVTILSLAIPTPGLNPDMDLGGKNVAKSKMAAL